MYLRSTQRRRADGSTVGYVQLAHNRRVGGVTRDVQVAGLEAMDEHQAYRAMDVLAAADCEAGVQEAVFFACADLLNLEVDLLFFDTTSTYLERDEPETGPDGAPGFRSLGHSKEHRPDLPQVVIGLAVTRE